MANLICACGKKYTVKQSDLKRGWGRSCSKPCAAKARTRRGRVATAAKKYTIKDLSAHALVEDYNSSIHGFSSEGLGQDEYSFS